MLFIGINQQIFSRPYMGTTRLPRRVCVLAVRSVASLYMASSRLPNGLVNRAQVLDCIYTYGLFVAQPCLAPMDFARRLLHISTASGALRLRRFCRRRSDLFAIESNHLCNR
jgi:hypothetical protein